MQRQVQVIGAGFTGTETGFSAARVAGSLESAATFFLAGFTAVRRVEASR